MTKRKREYQMVILCVLPLLAVVAAKFMHANYPLGIILFWGLPSLVLTFWAKDKALKAALFAAAGTILLTTLDIIFWANKQWVVISALKSKLFGLVAWEDIPYWFLYVYFPVLFWEHFLEHKKREINWTKRMSKFFGAVTVAFLVIAVVWTWLPKLLIIPYFYLIATVVFTVIPIVLEFRDHPKLWAKFVRVGTYFAYVAILYELTALSLEQWYYPSNQFVGWMDIGGLRFPVEELFGWILLGATAILSCYQYLDDYRGRE